MGMHNATFNKAAGTLNATAIMVTNTMATGKRQVNVYNKLQINGMLEGYQRITEQQSVHRWKGRTKGNGNGVAVCNPGAGIRQLGIQGGGNVNKQHRNGNVALVAGNGHQGNRKAK